MLQIQLLRTFYISVSDPNTISVTIRGNDTDETSTVTYTRVDDEIRQKLIDRPDAQAVLSPLPLLGRYMGTLGLSVDFQYPRITWTDNGRQRTGTYIPFSLAEERSSTTRFRFDPGGPGRCQLVACGVQGEAGRLHDNAPAWVFRHPAHGQRIRGSQRGRSFPATSPGLEEESNRKRDWVACATCPRR